MSNKGKFVDSTPFIPFAGVTTAIENLNADQSIRQDLYFKPSTTTPAKLVKYRNTIREIPGRRQLHRGIFDDPKDYEQLVHGVKTKWGDHVPDCIKGTNLNGTKYLMNNLQEAKYASTWREPLGKSIIRNYKFPEEVKKEGFKFGIPTTGFYNAKDVIYNGCLLSEPNEVKKMYQKTHGLSDPGEQKDREYKWNFDKNNHVFGKPQEKEFDGVKKSLLMDQLEGPYPPTKVTNKHLEDFRQATEDMVGRSKSHGSLLPTLGPDHTFGLKSKLGDAWNAGRCIYGNPSEITKASLEPDPDLGRDFRYKLKNKKLTPIDYGYEKTFGVPSIRSDLPKKHFVSVTDTNNYGDEKDAFELLYPHPCATRGIDDEDFDHLYTKEEIIGILKENNYEFPESEFNLIYEIAMKNYPNEEKKLSPNSFLSTMRNLKREYMKYRTLVKA